MAYIVVIGAGVIGLQTALTLLEAGYKVSIVAKYLPGDEAGMYTSPWAGAIWRTHATAEQKETCEWDLASYAEWIKATEEDGGVEGVRMGIERRQIRVYSSKPTPSLDSPSLWFAPHVQSFRTLAADEIPTAAKSGIAYDGIAVNPLKYLAYLLRRVKELGGYVIQGELPVGAGLAEAVRTAAQLVSAERKGRRGEEAANEAVDIDAIVNCTGLGAATLCNDEALFPIRGQTLLVRFAASPPPKRILLSESEDGAVTYVIPRPGTDLWVFGGTKTKGVWDVEVNERIGEQILDRCLGLLGREGEGVEVLGKQVGLRPGREGGVRVEVEVVDLSVGGLGDGEGKSKGMVVVHQYGHAGAGYQNAVGSARKVLGLLGEALGTSTKAV